MNDINKIYQDYSKVVYKYILALSKSEDIAEEIVQETFLVAIQQIDKFKKTMQNINMAVSNSKIFMVQKD